MYTRRERDLIEKYGTCDQHELMRIAAKMYDADRHDEDSIYFDDSYTGPSERELNGGCNRCGGWDDCYCVY